MATKPEAAPVCEVIGVFHTAADLESAIDELLRSGFDRAELSLLANEDAIRKKLGRHYSSVGEMADDTEVPRAAFVSTEAIGDAEGGPGGMLGSALARWVGRQHAAYLHDQIQKGGLLLWVRVWNESDEERALGIVAKHAADQVHSHGICGQAA